MRYVFSCFAAASAVWLTACAGPGAPALPLTAPAALAGPLSQGAAAWPQAQWWRALADPQLDALIEQALADSDEPGRQLQRSLGAFDLMILGVAVAVGAISEADHANSIIAAGRADLCAIARPHLADPYWTLHAAAQLGYTGEAGLDWPQPYLSGRDQLYRNLARSRVLEPAEENG